MLSAQPGAVHFTALYNDAVHRNTPLSVKKPAAAGLKFFYYFTPRQNFCQRPGRKIAPFTQYRRPFLLFPGSLYKAHIRCCGPCTVRVSVGVGFHPRPGVGFRNSPVCPALSLRCAACSTPFLWSCPKKRGGAPKKGAWAGTDARTLVGPTRLSHGPLAPVSDS